MRPLPPPLLPSGVRRRGTIYDGLARTYLGQRLLSVAREGKRERAEERAVEGETTRKRERERELDFLYLSQKPSCYVIMPHLNGKSSERRADRTRSRSGAHLEIRPVDRGAFGNSSGLSSCISHRARRRASGVALARRDDGEGGWREECRSEEEWERDSRTFDNGGWFHLLVGGDVETFAGEHVQALSRRPGLGRN